MDLRQKLEFQEVIDNYLADHEIYELFQGYISDLMIDRPSDPITYLMKKISKPDNRRLLIIGGSGRIRKEVSKAISARFQMDIISSGELLREEVERNGKLSSKIQASWKEGTYVKDSLVLDIVLPVLEQCENERSSYVLEGIPRTKAQAIALQRAGIIPDRVIVLQMSPNNYKSDFISNFSQYAHVDADIESVAELALQEYELGMQGVEAEYTFQCHHVPVTDDLYHVAETVYKAFFIKGRGFIARKPPKVLIIGGPLSGKTTQTQQIAQRYGLTLVKIKDCIDQAIAEKSEIGNLLANYVNLKQVIPDKIIIEIMRERLERTDCKMNGWVLDGFPSTFEQCRALRYLKKNPTNVYFLEANDNLVYERASFRRIDPKTGKIYGKELQETSGTVALAEDTEENVRARVMLWREDTIKIHAEFSKIAKSIKAELTPQIIFDTICDSLETSIVTEMS